MTTYIYHAKDYIKLNSSTGYLTLIFRNSVQFCTVRTLSKLVGHELESPTRPRVRIKPVKRAGKLMIEERIG